MDDADSYLREIFEKLCELAQKPCRTNDFTCLRRLRNLINASADQQDVIRNELQDVVRRFDEYLNKDLAPLTAAARVPQAEHAAQLERAMQQEHARMQLHTAVTAAQQKIRALRKA